MKKLSFLLVLLLSALQIDAQKLQLTVQFPNTADVEGLRLYAAPLKGEYVRMQELKADGSKMVLEVEASPYGFYNVMSVKAQTQYAMPLYVPAGTEAATLEVRLQDGKQPHVVNNTDNEALSRFNMVLMERDRKLWTEKLSDEELRQMFGNYAKQAEDAVGEGVSQIVKDYLKIWSYTSTYNGVRGMHRAMRVDADSVPFRVSDVLPAPSEVLDCDLATIFQSTSGIIMGGMPKGKLADRIDWLRANYRTESLRNSLETSMLESFVSGHNYWLHYDEGLVVLKEVVAKYGFDNKYVEEYQKFKRATKGADFPAEVVLKDVDGNVVDFAKFRGKYVYIDVCASWCGPCCKEVPHLQKLEAELQNEDVVFVSISVDATEAPWKSKMTALNMHGNQLIDSGKNFNRLMNIRGIPHFLIYDKEGKLYLYKAPRPSAGGTRDLLEGLK